MSGPLHPPPFNTAGTLQKSVGMRFLVTRTSPFIQVFPLILLFSFLMDSQPAWTHLDRMKDIDHLTLIDSASSFLNIQVVLHFHELPSLQVRKGRMDMDSNGTITTIEIDQFRSALERKLLNHFSLTVDRKSVPLVILYRPEVDLLENDKVQQAPHLLKFFFTASFPMGTTETSLFRFEDRSFTSNPGQSRIEIREICEDHSRRIYETSTSRSVFFSLPSIQRNVGSQYHHPATKDIQERNHEISR